MSIAVKTQPIASIVDFGHALLNTGDLDPVYIGLSKANLPRDQLARLLLAYWCFYHIGAAAWLSEQQGWEYWKWMKIAAENKTSPRDLAYGGPSDRWPRAAERRHFRGDKCVRAVEWFANRYADPGDPVVVLTQYRTDKTVMAAVQQWPMFGPWIAFKVADMMERVWGAEIKFDPNLGLMYEEPRAALSMLKEHHPTWSPDTPEGYYRKLLLTFSPMTAPPRLGGRRCGPQEVETILCKWKSYVGGHYWVGKDIHEQRAALTGWGVTADRITLAYPREVSRG